jgi:hypothetical protein
MAASLFSPCLVLCVDFLLRLLGSATPDLLFFRSALLGQPLLQACQDEIVRMPEGARALILRAHRSTGVGKAPMQLLTRPGKKGHSSAVCSQTVTTGSNDWPT